MNRRQIFQMLGLLPAAPIAAMVRPPEPEKPKVVWEIPPSLNDSKRSAGSQHAHTGIFREAFDTRAERVEELRKISERWFRWAKEDRA